MSNLTIQQKQGLQALKGALNKEGVYKRIQEMLGRKPDSYITSVMQVVSSNSMLVNATQESVTGAVFTACALGLPINNNLGFAYIVPFKKKAKIDGQWMEVVEAQLQIGYKGFIQLAQNTGKVKRIDAVSVYDTDTEESVRKRLTSLIPQKVSGEIIGYTGLLETIGGFEAIVTMTNDDIEEHATKYSQTYKYAKSQGKTNSVWHEQRDAMAKKTIIKALMKFCPMSVELQKAIDSDQGVIDTEGNVEFIDNQDVSNHPIARIVPNENFQEFLNAIESGNLNKADALNPEIYALTEQQRQVVASA